VGQTTDPGSADDPLPLPNNLIGEANEVRGFVEDVPCTTLVDSGSQVTTVSKHFYDTYLHNMPVQSCSDLLLQGAGGNNLPYLGYVFLSVRVDGMHNTVIPTLIVPTTGYNERVPLLVGTNFLRHSEPNPSEALLDAVRLAMQSVHVDDQHLQQTNGVWGSIYAVEDIVLDPSETICLCGRVQVEVHCASDIGMTGVVHEQQKYDITPCLVNARAKTVCVEVVNHSDSKLVIKEGDSVAKLHQVTIVGSCEEGKEEACLLKEFDLTQLEESASAEELKVVKQMIAKWKNIFSSSSTDLGKTSVLKHRIDLLDDTPVKERARRINPNLLEELRQHIQELHSMGVIEESVSPWSSPIVVVRKKNGDIRMCVDYRKLNSQTVRDSYRIPTIDELIDMLGGSKWFATLDLSSGYHQVEVEPAHRERTAFTAGPLGFWQYTRMPFGLTNAPATFQRLMERSSGCTS